MDSLCVVSRICFNFRLGIYIVILIQGTISSGNDLLDNTHLQVTTAMNRSQKLRYLFVLVLFTAATSALQAQNFPGETWDKFASPENAGFSTAKLEAAKAYGDKIQTAALTVVVEGKIVYEWGEVKKKYKTHANIKRHWLEKEKAGAELLINHDFSSGLKFLFSTSCLRSYED